MKTVTYRGPDDPLDGTTRYRIGDYLLPKGVPVPDIPDEVAKQLEATEGHSFDVTAKGRQKTDKPEEGATEED